MFILKTLLLISKISERKSETCLWIPKNNTFFWNELAQENNNAFLPFWAVALSELALIDGYPLSNNLKSMFGYGSYKKQSGESKDNPTLEKIKIRAKEKGFMKLIVLTDHKNFKTYEYSFKISKCMSNTFCSYTKDKTNFGRRIFLCGSHYSNNLKYKKVMGIVSLT